MARIDSMFMEMRGTEWPQEVIAWELTKGHQLFRGKKVWMASA